MFETKSRFFRKLMEGLRCIDEFTLKCLDREHRAYFNTLYAGTTQVIIDLCKEGEYQKGQLNSLYISIGGKNFLNQNTITTFKCTCGIWAKINFTDSNRILMSFCEVQKARIIKIRPKMPKFDEFLKNRLNLVAFAEISLNSDTSAKFV